MPEGLPAGPFYPKERAEEIEKAQTLKGKREKAWAWKVLETVIRLETGRSLKECDLSKSPNGKWESPFFFFSLSHAREICGVAIGEMPLGLDVESADDKRLNKRYVEKIMTSGELERLGNNLGPIEAISLWTKKESVFKLKGLSGFVPREVESAAADSYLVSVHAKRCVVSLASDPDGEKPRFMELSPDLSYASKIRDAEKIG